MSTGNDSEEGDLESWFEEHRSYLLGVAYRMLGSMSDAEDVLQDAFLRAQKATNERLRSPRAYLSTMITRLCLDQLKSARAKRESYVGPWLPEPILDAGSIGALAPSPGKLLSLQEDISLALLLALERLSPSERAAFLLHDVFDVDYAEISQTLGREQSAVRKLVSRARTQVRDERSRFSPHPTAAEELLSAFQCAVSTGSLKEIHSLLADDVSYTSDGGGKVSAATKVIKGKDHVAKFLLGLARRFPDSATSKTHASLVNGQPGMLLYDGERLVQALSYDIDGDKVRAFYAVRNPEKLKHLSRTTI